MICKSCDHDEIYNHRKIAKSQNRSMWQSFALTARRGLPAQLSACRGPCCAWLSCWWPPKAARGSGRPRWPTSGSLCKFSSLKAIRHWRPLLLSLCSQVLSLATVAGTCSLRVLDLFQGAEIPSLIRHRGWYPHLWAILAFSRLFRHFDINF